jgi:DNA-binding transcriptional LysR family regulator
MLQLAGTSKLRIVKPPLPIPDFGVQLVWHQRMDDDAGSVWLRDQIVACAAEL